MHREYQVKTVVVTGGIGAGKSEVCSCLSSAGIPVYDSDSRTKALYDENPGLVEALEKEFGTTLRNADGKLDRCRLAQIIFSDSGKLFRLESVVHPAVYEDFVRWRETMAQENRIVVMESAIFLDKPLFHPLADVVMYVDAPVETRVGRIIARDGCTKDEALLRMANQKQDRTSVDYVITNDGDLGQLKQQVDSFLKLMNF